MDKEEFVKFIIESERRHIDLLCKISSEIIEMHKGMKDSELKERFQKLGMHVSIYGILHEINMKHIYEEGIKQMPLVKGKSKKSIEKNIDTLIHKEGKAPKQAVGEAYGIARQAKKKSPKKKS